MEVKNARLSYLCVAAVIMCLRVLPTSPAPVGKRTAVDCGAGNGAANVTSILPGIIVTLKILQEKILPRPSDTPENLLEDLWTSLDVLLQLDEIMYQTAPRDSILEPFLSPLSRQMQLWIGSKLNCSSTRGCSRDEIVALRTALKTNKKLQLALTALQEMENKLDQDATISERDWIKSYVLCSGNAINGTILAIVNELGYNITFD